MTVQAIESTLHKCQRRHARGHAAIARGRNPIRLIVLSAPDRNAIADAPVASQAPDDRAYSDLDLATWEDAEWL